jgi:hypothetical protein
MSGRCVGGRALAAVWVMVGWCACCIGADDLWPEPIHEQVGKQFRLGDRPLGYSSRQMASFGGYSYRMGYVSRLFQNAEQVPNETNRLARRLMEGDVDRATAVAIGLLGGKTSRGEVVPCESSAIVPVDAAAKSVWESLPEEVHQAVAALVGGAVGARPLLHEAFDWDALGRHVGDPKVAQLGDSRVYHYAAAPWLGYSARGSGSVTALKTFQATPLASAGGIFLSSVRIAIDHLLALSPEGELVEFESCRLRTPAGSVCILGRGDNTYQGRDAIVIDLGGNDRYSGRLAVPRSKSVPVGVLIDIAGNDVYDSRQAPASIACGLFGIGALFDLAGNDKYSCGSSGLGCAWHGIGLLVDRSGNDVYSGHQWCQGAAHAGVGLLLDDAGDDRYFCQLESQGLGGTLGVGVLIDKQGNDRYHAYDDEGGRRITFPSSQTKAHEVSLSQGCGYGRRADGSDGQSLAGGVGALVDGAGDDSYYGGVFSQGIGFWWSLGMLVDFGGRDQYRGVYFAQGASAHFAIGSLVDHDGNDKYNDARVLGQVLGAGRDGSIGAFVDLAGDDQYYIPKKSAGGGDMNSIGLFCDWQGDDTYHSLVSSSLGTASFSNPYGERVRNEMPTVGVFADLGGKDKYSGHGSARNGTTWRLPGGGSTWGLGIDMQYEAPPAEAVAGSTQ